MPNTMLWVLCLHKYLYSYIHMHSKKYYVPITAGGACGHTRTVHRGL